MDIHAVQLVKEDKQLKLNSKSMTSVSLLANKLYSTWPKCNIENNLV